MTLQRILTGLVDSLLHDKLLELAEGASPDLLAQELADQINHAPAFSKAGAVLARVLLESPLVAELYASDSEIIERLGALNL